MAQRVRKASLWVESSPTRSERRGRGIAAGGGAQYGHDVAGRALPVEVELAGARVEEDEASGVHRPDGPICSGVIFARREVKNSRISLLVSTSFSVDLAAIGWETLPVALSTTTLSARDLVLS